MTQCEELASRVLESIELLATCHGCINRASRKSPMLDSSHHNDPPQIFGKLTMDRHWISVNTRAQSELRSETATADFNLKSMLKCAEEERDVDWLKRMLQFAVQLEFATIPPYLTAYWSVKTTTTSIVQNMIYSVALQEMLHMGLVCNILTSLGATPQIAATSAIPEYPGHLPGRVHPTLWVDLRPLSRELIADTFMVIEEPEGGAIRYSQGQTYPTIGAFYSAIQSCISKLPDSAFAGGRQVVL